PVAVVDADRPARAPDRRFEGPEASLFRGIDEVGVKFRRNIFRDAWGAEIEETASAELAAQNGVADLHLRDRQPRVGRAVVGVGDLLRRRNPAVALAEDR